jgi:hypothetical protein
MTWCTSCQRDGHCPTPSESRQRPVRRPISFTTLHTFAPSRATGHMRSMLALMPVDVRSPCTRLSFAHPTSPVAAHTRRALRITIVTLRYRPPWCDVQHHPQHQHTPPSFAIARRVLRPHARHDHWLRHIRLNAPRIPNTAQQLRNRSASPTLSSLPPRALRRRPTSPPSMPCQATHHVHAQRRHLTALGHYVAPRLHPTTRQHYISQHHAHT